MNSRDTLIGGTAAHRSTLNGVPHEGMPSHANGATNRTATPGPLDLIPAKRRRRSSTATPTAKRTIGGEQPPTFTMASVAPSSRRPPPPPALASGDRTQATTQYRQGSRPPQGPVQSRDSTSRHSHYNNNASAARAFTGIGRKYGGGSGGGAGGDDDDRREPSGVAEPIVISSDEDDDFQNRARAKKRPSLQGSEIEQVIEIPSSSDEEQGHGNIESDTEDFVSGRSQPRRLAVPQGASSSSLRQSQNLSKQVNGATKGVTGTGTVPIVTPSTQLRASAAAPSPSPAPSTALVGRGSQVPPSAGGRGRVASGLDRSRGQPLQHHGQQQKQPLQQPRASGDINSRAIAQLPPSTVITLPSDRDRDAGGNTTERERSGLSGLDMQIDRARQSTQSLREFSSHNRLSKHYQRQQQREPQPSDLATISNNFSTNITAAYNKVNKLAARTASLSSRVASPSIPLSSNSISSSQLPSSQPKAKATQPSTTTGSEPIVIVPSPSPAPGSSPALAPTTPELAVTPLSVSTMAEPSSLVSSASSTQPVRAKPRSAPESGVQYGVETNLSRGTNQSSISAVVDVEKVMDLEVTFDSHDYHYDDDYLLGGELERYQQEIRNRNAQWRTQLNAKKHAEEIRGRVYQEQMEVIIEQVADANRLLRRADWDTIARITSVRSGEPISAAECKAAFEAEISWRRPKEKALKKAGQYIPIKTSSLSHLLAARALGSKSYDRGYVHDLIFKAQTKTYRCATSFNYGSGSIVDMAMKYDGTSFEVLVGSVATQDIYNRSGNLLLCDFKAGLTTPLTGHEVRTSAHPEPVAKTVNDVKLSFSKRFFFSASDDMTAKGYYWNILAVGMEGIGGVGTGQIAKVFTNQYDVNLVGFSPCETYMISCSAKNDIVVFDRRFLQTGLTTSALDVGGQPNLQGASRRKGGKSAARRETEARQIETKPLHSFFHDSVDELPTSGISSALWWPSSPPPAGRAYPDVYEGFRSNHGSMAWLVTGGGDGVVRAWDVGRATEDAEVWKLEAKVGPIACVMASPDFDDVVVGGETSMVSLYTMSEGTAAQYQRKAMRLLERDDQ
ncbi:hypothetical protein BGZ73_004788 [Actinomortierella ambigua]|nr:hypothetical protein BGZ73_004788 [Actinomortierella ambigua]